MAIFKDGTDVLPWANTSPATKPQTQTDNF